MYMTVSGQHIIAIDFSAEYNDLIGIDQFDHVNECIIPEHYPIEGRGIFEKRMRYVQFDRNMGSDEAVLAELERKRFAPAQLVHTARFGICFPDYQQYFPLIGLGQRWKAFNGCLFGLCLDRWACKKWLGIVSGEEGGYHQHCRFLVVEEDE